MEQLEQEEATAGSMIAVKKTKGKGKSIGRETKLPLSTNSLVTQPTPFAEAIDPVVPEFKVAHIPKHAHNINSGLFLQDTS